MNRVHATATATTGALLWATLGPVVDALDGVDAVIISAARALGATVLLGVIARGEMFALRRAVAHRRSLIVGAVGLAGFQYSYFTAVEQAGVAISTIVAIGLAPALTGMWTWIRAARPATTWFAASSLALLGLVLLVAEGVVAEGGVSVGGIGWASAAAAFFAMQALAIEQVDRQWSSTAALTWMFALSAVVTLPFCVTAVAAATPLRLTEGAMLLYLGLVTAGLAYWCFAAGIEELGAASAVTISLLEPAAAVLIAALFLSEELTPTQWVGVLLLIACVPLAAWRATPARPGPPQVPSLMSRYRPTPDG